MVMPDDDLEFVEKVARVLDGHETLTPSLNEEGSAEMQALMKKRYFGSLRNDLGGFKKQMKFVNSKVAHNQQVHHDLLTVEGRNAFYDETFDQFLDEKQQIEKDIGFSSMLKKNQKLFMEKREKSDFVKGS